MSITLDNARNNTLAIDKQKLKYEPPMEGRFYHSRCVAHIINLCMQDGLAVPTINNLKESFKTMLKDVFRSGGKNHQRYVRICKQAGKPYLSPHWDVLTRWNSTYHMFLSGLKQKSTLMYFHDLLASKGSGRVLSIRRTRLTPVFLEMCMCLKDHLDAQKRKQDKSTLETPVNFEEEILDVEVQANEGISLSDEEIAIDAASSEGGDYDGDRKMYDLKLLYIAYIADALLAFLHNLYDQFHLDTYKVVKIHEGTICENIAYEKPSATETEIRSAAKLANAHEFISDERGVQLPRGKIYSQAFHLGGQGFFLSAHCNMDQQISFHCFGLFLGMHKKGSDTFEVDYEFAARSKPTKKYISKYTGKYTFTGGKVVGYRNLFVTPWTYFIDEDSLYFINGILHL
uniref:Zinc finger BED domain-containing protein RICESLEEPER 2-like n=1 Tax=Tanacetum cinerariifolium TaxID=118510 RepID=A0A6L2K0A2_TANCI|nr:hypothetical protein [Tanacetum cinerariifolium]